MRIAYDCVDLMERKEFIMKDTFNQLSLVTVILHWVVGLGVVALLGMGLYMESLPNSPDKFELYGIHKSVGVIIFCLAILRVLWRVSNGLPRALTVPPAWQASIALIVHVLLLVATLSMPISGVIMNYSAGLPLAVFGFEILGRAAEKNQDLGMIAHTIHSIGGKVFIGLIVLHVLAALKHHFIDRDASIKRILGRKV